jgi:hypothetical protein
MFVLKKIGTVMEEVVEMEARSCCWYSHVAGFAFDEYGIPCAGHMDTADWD